MQGLTVSGKKSSQKGSAQGSTREGRKGSRKEPDKGSTGAGEGTTEEGHYVGMGTTLNIFLELGSATQAPREIAREKGLYYVGFDLREWVFSAETSTWVQNVVMDYTKHSPAEVWEKAVEVVREATGWKGKVGLGLLWVSPPCHTYSAAQIINFHKGTAYRDHTTQNKEPVKGDTKYSREAKAMDSLVKHVLKMVEWFVTQMGIFWVIENPKGFLADRPFMRSMPMDHTLHLVDYCAYRGKYKKPTHIWTNLVWSPRGTTGTGRCEDRCERGMYTKATNRWVHEFAMAQQSWQAVQGQGRSAAKASVPKMLHQELLTARVTTMHPMRLMPCST